MFEANELARKFNHDIPRLHLEKRILDTNFLGLCAFSKMDTRQLCRLKDNLCIKNLFYYTVNLDIFSLYSFTLSSIVFA